MTDFSFFKQPKRMSLADILDVTGAHIRAEDADKASFITFCGVGALDIAGKDEITFLEHKKYLSQLKESVAGACFVSPALAEEVAKYTLALIVDAPHLAYVKVAREFYPAYAMPGNVLFREKIHHSAVISDKAKIGSSSLIGANVFIGKGVEIGDDCIVEANAVIKENVKLGNNCKIGACASVGYCIMGDNVNIYPGVCIGQDGFGFIMSAQGHTKVPQLGRVIIGNDVEIGANTCVDRGASGDTVIGEGTKIDNMCQIAHNVKIGKHCVFASYAGISGSVEIGDFVIAGGNVGFKDHVKVGTGAQLAARTGVTRDIRAGEVVSGMPPFPIKEQMRQIAALKKLANGEYVKKTDLDKK
ncbi:MAG: UDP-3-O-(3-hydroxymyristoyl)glucosamine N-acyltransferase [Alphaproteobacteria bacterium]|nr:UDP-3-O-(3-hydroxymyristoyl)glucosamine N-acyltransferase [Alphaproteobacteria bacterium]